tara:strand:+ start:308 stop:2767 length:2460 start_codon:yes stop_codon:yes gene_type:complete
MSVVGSNILAGSSGQATGYDIDQSLRFNAASSDVLSKAAGSAGNLDSWTISAWLKRGSLTHASHGHNFFGQGDSSPNPPTQMKFYTNNAININMYNTNDSTQVVSWTSDAIFRDPAAWYHVVIAWDNTLSAPDFLKIYVNGVRIYGTNTVTWVVGTDSSVNGAYKQELGRYVYNSTEYYDGYMAEYYFIDGSTLTPSSFGETDADTNQWKPIEYDGTYGAEGWYLKFVSGAIGADSSGNGNTFTATNLSATTDVVIDTPTNNYCTWSPLWVPPISPTARGKLSEGNLSISSPDTSSASYNGATLGTIGVASGKWYFEYYAASANYPAIGIAKTDYNQNAAGTNVGNRAWLDDGSLYGATSSASGTTWTTGDIIGCAVDMDNGKMWFSKDGAFISSGDPAAGTNAQFTDLLSGSDMSSFVTPFWSDVNWGTTDSGVLNCGQDSSFSAAKTAQGNGGTGEDFYYTPPTGFKALNTDNLSDPAIALPTDHFSATIWSGNDAASRAITTGVDADFVWYKDRTGTESNSLYDSVRGAQKRLISNSTDYERTRTTGLLSFDSTGFTVGADTECNGSGKNYVAWNWKAGGTASTIAAGSIDGTNPTIASSVSANTTAGFSIVSYAGSGTTATVGHGLGVAPELIIIKNRTSTAEWPIYEESIGNAKRLELNSTAAEQATNNWDSTSTTASVFTVYGGETRVNISSNDYIAYCFHSVEGYSKIGVYEGNANADGPFVYTGFQPAFVIIKGVDQAGSSWFLMDNKRDEYNVVDKELFADSNSAEGSGSRFVDFNSNGFKLRANDALNYASTMLYYAVSESPFKTSNAR